MENRKGVYQNATNNNSTQNSNAILNETLTTKQSHQHNTAPQHLRLLQYGMKIPNQINARQQLNSPLHLHVHQHNQQLQYQTTHRHLPHPSHSPQYNNVSQQQPQTTNQKFPQKPNSQIFQNQNIYYQTTVPPPPPPLHPHPQLIQQNTPQIWVPHQPPPIHYHQQQIQNKTDKANNSNNHQVQSPKPKEIVERKKSIGNSCQLKSPAAKRPLEAPVTMQGWLHKQGSEGLMLWKKRWFVLSEYCLFYYKGLEEEKLLGSILLPSYKVSICGPEDKVNRKYAFKCEHANMRTYILAADSHELMLQWIRVLDLACTLQSTVDTDDTSALPEPNSQTNSDTKDLNNIKQQRNHTASVHMHSSSNTTDLSNQSQQELSQYNQPLYANAPPKPRRLNDGFSSPSPDVLDRYANQQYYHHAKSPIIKSPYNYSHSMPLPQQIQPEHMLHQPNRSTKLVPHDYTYNTTREYNVPQNSERRTPDTYGRSKLNPSKTRQQIDYEDVYIDQTMYKRPLSPIAYNHAVKKNNLIINPAYRTYTPVNMLGPKDVPQYGEQQTTSQLRKSPTTITRPHSADFLEYEFNHRQTNPIILNKLHPRPKSSLDINRNTNDCDNYFYSEERYAEKMRKSAQYLQNMPIRQANDFLLQQKVTPTIRYSQNEPTFPLIRSNTQPLNYNNLQLNNTMHVGHQPVRSRSVLSEGSLSKELDVDIRDSTEHLERESISPGFASGPNSAYMMAHRGSRIGDQFNRSASARLSQNDTDEQNMDGTQIHRDGDRKREESMKRLLEWKQRMLQSPLNRKVQGNRSYLSRHEYNQQANQQNIYMAPSYPDIERGRSIINLPQYNSYSSDDEENVKRNKESVHTQAGRTLDTFPNNSECLTPSHSISTTVFNTIKEPDKPLITTSNICMQNNLHSITKSLQSSQNEQKHSENEELTKPLKQFNKDLSHIAHVSSLKSEYSDKFEQSPVVTEIKSNGALVKSILAEFEKTDNTDDDERNNIRTPTNDTILEENYMTMTPKKNILDPKIMTDIEENPYVEMSQNSTSSNVTKNEQQPYELVCFNEGKLEPVYMELKQPQQENLNKEPQELPDILLSPKHKSNSFSNKSDSSDADDEASKDLDSLDTPNKRIFSLSDSFRPASYYLGASQNVQEFPDSSDSELVSPPPIPISPSPLDDLDDSLLSNLDLNTVDQTKKHRRNSDQFFNSIQPLSNKHSSLSLNDPDISSICSTNTDSKRYNLSINSDSENDVQIRIRTDYERMLKRKPVSEEFCDELESISETFDNVDLDRYLHELETSSLSSQMMNKTNNSINIGHEYENVLIKTEKKKSVNDGQIILNEERARPSSSTSATVENCTLMHSSNCSTPNLQLNSPHSPHLPYFSTNRHKNNSNSNSYNQQTAPYYYSDLSVNSEYPTSNLLTLNNQRSTIINGNKKYITHIVNPIKNVSDIENADKTFKLAAEARSVSVDFLNLTDKSGHIDKKNLYESDTLKRQKALELNTVQNSQTINYYPATKDNKFIENNIIVTGVRRTHSLEGLLENVLTENENNSNNNSEVLQTSEGNSALEGSYLWDEDAIWRERLRSASQRHTKSMENLDSISVEGKKSPKKSARGITRGVTYVNDNIYNIPLQDKHKTEDNKDSCAKKEIKKENSFLIDREKLRQWDLMSSAPSDDQLSCNNNNNKGSQEPRGNNTVVELGQGCCEPTENSNAENSASGSISLNARDTFPRAVNSKKIWGPNSQPMQTCSITNLNKNLEDEQIGSHHPGYYVSQSSSQQELNSDNIYNRKETVHNNKMNVSAGELLGRTHEELVLLLIQLRRQSAHTLQAIEIYYNEIDTIQAQLHLMDQARRLENLQKLEQIKQHLLELEKQYEKGKPLVNLVDNMVKLGSLYRLPSDKNNISPYIRDRLEFNQQIQERRLLAEEKRDWNRLNPNHFQLQEKVQQLYQLDKLIQEESGTLYNLQQDKEDIERALGGLRLRLNKGFNDPAEIEQARKQQILLENELSRVHTMLAKNSKKLEETVAGNARLEQELLVLKQKLQTSRQQRSSPQFSNAGDSLPCAVGTSAMLESDLQKVQKKIGDLQKQRQELSMQVRQLTDRSNNLVQIKSSPSNMNNQCNKRKVPSLWRETDLDTMDIIDHGEWENQVPTNTPLYINSELKQSADSDFYNSNIKSSDSTTTTEDTAQNATTLNEKQEIKTVRIVKRESERRQRDREKTSTGKWDALTEEDDSSQNSSILFRPTSQKNTNLPLNSLCKQTTSISSPSLTQFGNCVQNNSSNSDINGGIEKNPNELSPIFKSEAARQIITEMAIQDAPPKQQLNRRAVPKEKRRHYTAPHNNMIMKSFHQLPTDDNAFDKMILNTRRARDDLDMERALRQRIDAPDVVRSTLSNKELKYNENTIDNILGMPNKINIPERYIPEQIPQLSAEEQEHRLRKVESIKKMLSDTAILSGSSKNISDEKKQNEVENGITSKATTKMIEEKKQREHLLQLNQILAKQVMEMSKIVAGNNNTDEK